MHTATGPVGFGDRGLRHADVDTEPLQILLKQPDIRQNVGVDISLGVEYRPVLTNNIILKGFGAILQPLDGFNDIFETNTLYKVGTEVVLVF